MKPDDLTTTDEGKADYISRAGWGVLSKEPHAGDRIELPGYMDEADTAVLTPVAHDADTPCEFCNDEGHVAERGVLAADYKLTLPGNGGEATDTVLYHTCHACFMGAKVVEREVREYDPGEVYVPRDEWDEPASANMHTAAEGGIIHPIDRGDA